MLMFCDLNSRAAMPQGCRILRAWDIGYVVDVQSGLCLSDLFLNKMAPPNLLLLVVSNDTPP